MAMMTYGNVNTTNCDQGNNTPGEMFHFSNNEFPAGAQFDNMLQFASEAVSIVIVDRISAATFYTCHTSPIANSP